MLCCLARVRCREVCETVLTFHAGVCESSELYRYSCCGVYYTYAWPITYDPPAVTTPSIQSQKLLFKVYCLSFWYTLRAGNNLIQISP